MKLEMESCRLALYPQHFHTLGQFIRYRSSAEENAEFAYLTYRLQRLKQKKEEEEECRGNQ